MANQRAWARPMREREREREKSTDCCCGGWSRALPPSSQCRNRKVARDREKEELKVIKIEWTGKLLVDL